MKNKIFIFCLLFPISFPTGAQVFDNRNSGKLAKIDRLDSIETFLAKYSENQNQKNAMIASLEKLNSDQSYEIKKLLTRLSLLEKKVKELEAKSNSTTKKTDTKSKNVNAKSASTNISAEIFNEYKENVKKTLDAYLAKIVDLETSVKTMQSLLIQNEKLKKNP